MAKTAATNALRHKSASHLAQNQKKRDDGRGVEQDIGEMMTAGMQSVKLAVQLMGKPGQRVPVGGVAGEGPDRPLERQTLGHHRIVRYITTVVEVNELVPSMSGRKRQR